MGRFKIDFSWEAPGAARGPELRATWAQLRLTADDLPITQVVDYRAKTVRENLYLPLYPLAEWIATHWWWLLYEVQSPARPQSIGYASRHNLRYAREGYALPDLNIFPMGGCLLLDWRAGELQEQRVRFVTSGRVEVALPPFAAELARVVEATLERLGQEGISQTFLHEEWRAIQDADASERDFCRAAALLGLEVYDTSDEDSQAIVDASRSLPVDIAEELLSAATPRELRAQTAAVSSAFEEIAGGDVELPSLVALKAAMPALNSGEPPWKTGYELARHARRQLGLNNGLLPTSVELQRALRVPDRSWHAAMLPFREDCAFLDALVAVNKAQSPGFLIEKQREDSWKFAFCRALTEFLSPAAGTSALISETRSQRQQQNRAFAAEFLAPATALRKLIAGNTISEEGVDEVAARCGVSSFVIRHQLQNHQIAEIVPET